MNYRPEYSHQWNSKTYYTQLRLDPLGKESADEMLTALLGDGAELQPLKRLIIERTEGNPFFMEETVQVLLDEGALVRNGAMQTHQAARRAEDSADGAGDPRRAHRSLAARREKDLLQTLAVIGKEFPLTLIRAVVPKSAESCTGCSTTCSSASSSMNSRRSAMSSTPSSTR